MLVKKSEIENINERISIRNDNSKRKNFDLALKHKNSHSLDNMITKINKKGNN